MTNDSDDYGWKPENSGWRRLGCLIVVISAVMTVLGAYWLLSVIEKIIE